MLNVDLGGKNALVVGGTGGIGLEIALLLKDLHADVVVAGRHSVEKSHGLRTVTVDFGLGPGELSRPEIHSLLEKCDILVFSYGPFVQKKLHETTADDWIRMAVDNYALPGIAVSTVLPGMVERKFGRILLFGGTRTFQINPYRTNAAYAGAKTGISVIIRSLSAEYSKHGITCNGIFPGFTRNAPGRDFAVGERTVAEQAVNLLCSPDLNGVLLSVDRGWNPGA